MNNEDRATNYNLKSFENTIIVTHAKLHLFYKSGCTRVETVLCGTDSTSHNSIFRKMITLLETELTELLKTTVTYNESRIFIYFFFILILDIPVGMYMQKYILLFSVVQSQPTHTLATCDQVPVSAQRAIIRPMTENYENQNSYLEEFISTPTYAHNHTVLLVYFPLYVYRRI
jgi:hypothetical protein